MTEPMARARVVDGWLVVDGCKVARVPQPGVLAFHDRDRRRCSERGSDQPSATIEEIAAAVKGGTDDRGIGPAGGSAGAAGEG